jgi:ubiquitin-like protein Pup
MEFKMTDKDETESVESEPQRAAQLADSVDGILDMIDDLLEENAEPFDPSYVQKGGQGWSTFVDPSYL